MADQWKFNKNFYQWNFIQLVRQQQNFIQLIIKLWTSACAKSVKVKCLRGILLVDKIWPQNQHLEWTIGYIILRNQFVFDSHLRWLTRLKSHIFHSRSTTGHTDSNTSIIENEIETKNSLIVIQLTVSYCCCCSQ